MFSFFKRRDTKVYPEDEMGDALYKHCSDPAKLPDKVYLWFDAYFDTEADADAVAKHLEQRNIEVIRDHDDEPDEAYGAWNLDFELLVRARHFDLKLADDETRRLVADYRGKVASCLILNTDEEDEA